MWVFSEIQLPLWIKNGGCVAAMELSSSSTSSSASSLGFSSGDEERGCFITYNILFWWFSFLTLLILFSGQEPQLDKQLIDYLEIGPTFLNSSGTFPALLHTCWCTVTFLILYIKLFCEHVLAIKDCNLGWAISLGSSHSLVIVPGLNIFEPAGLLGLF